MESNLEKPIFYTVVVSGHNLPNLVSILLYQPAHVALVVSDNPKFLTLAKRLIKKIGTHLPETKITQFESQGLGGECLEEMQHWMKNQLMPFYRVNKNNYRWFLNVTGGTKIIPMLLESVLPWDEIHYKGINIASLQAWQFDQGVRKMLKHPKASTSYSLSPVEALSLYTSVKSGSLNRVEQSDLALPRAQKIWDMYQDFAQKGSANVHTDLSRVLNDVWSKREQGLFKEKEVLIEWSEFEFSQEDVSAWVEGLIPEVEGIQVCYTNELGVWIPGNKLGSSKADKARKDWQKWVSGLWLETLAESWLNSVGLNFNRSVDIVGKKRELDFVILHKEQLQVVEAKAAPNLEESLHEIIRQIRSVRDIGMLKNYLLISPYFKTIVSDKSWKDFEESCTMNQIQLCTSKSDLLNAFG